MPRENIRMPSSSAGVMTFYDEERSSIRIQPTHVIIMCIVVAVVIIILNYTSILK